MGLMSRIFGKKIEPLEAVADELVETSIVCGNAFVNSMAKDNDGKQTSNSASNALAANEFLYLFLHFVNRLAYSFGGVSAQKKLCDRISIQAVKKMANLAPTKLREDATFMLQQGVNETERDYAKCKRIFSEGDESPKGTLFWEAAKKISNVAGGGMDIANIVMATEMMTNSISTLKLNERMRALARGV